MLLTTIQLSREHAALVTYTCCILHNLLSIRRPQQYLQKLAPQPNVQQPDLMWQEDETLVGLQAQWRNTTHRAAVYVRDHLCDFYNSHVGKVPWQ